MTLVFNASPLIVLAKSGLLDLILSVGNRVIIPRPVADEIAIPSAFQAFGPDGHLVDPQQEEKVKALGAALAVQLKKTLA